MHDHLSLSLEMDDYYRLSINTNALFLFFRCNISLSNSCHQNWEQYINYLNKPMGELENRSKEGERDIARLTQARLRKRNHFLVTAKHPYTIHISYSPSYQVVAKRNPALPFPHIEVRSPCILPAQKIDSIPSHV